MTGKTHLTGGVLSSLAILPFTGNHYQISFLLFAVFGALAPDIDATESIIKHVKINVSKRIKIKKARTFIRAFGWKMGLEPTTLGTTNRCSNQLSYNYHVAFIV